MVSDAKAGDIYADQEGVLWRVKSTCWEPSVVMEQIEGHRFEKGGGISALQWKDFKRIFRVEKNESEHVKNTISGHVNGVDFFRPIDTTVSNKP